MNNENNIATANDAIGFGKNSDFCRSIFLAQTGVSHHLQLLGRLTSKHIHLPSQESVRPMVSRLAQGKLSIQTCWNPLAERYGFEDGQLPHHPSVVNS